MNKIGLVILTGESRGRYNKGYLGHINMWRTVAEVLKDMCVKAGGYWSKEEIAEAVIFEVDKIKRQNPGKFDYIEVNRQQIYNALNGIIRSDYNKFIPVQRYHRYNDTYAYK